MDDAVRQSTVILTSLGDVDQARFQQALRQHPDLGMRVAEALDQRAGAIGISARRRMQLRAAASQITTRMRNQHPAVLADEYLRKTNKAYVRHGQPELARKLAARAGEQLFWAPVVAAAPAAPYAPPASAPASAARPAFGPSANSYVPPGGDPYGNYNGPSSRTQPMAPQPPALPLSNKHPGDGAFRAAGWMFGIGLASLAGGGIIVALGAFPGVFLMTVGVVLILIAIVTALVGLIIRAAG
jgi:hypothetical protein